MHAVRCASGAPGVRVVKSVSTTTLCAYTAIGRENRTRSTLEAFLIATHPLISRRIAAKADRIEILENDKALLLAALKDISNSGELKPGQRAKVSLLLQKVSPIPIIVTFLTCVKGLRECASRKFPNYHALSSKKRVFA